MPILWLAVNLDPGSRQQVGNSPGSGSGTGDTCIPNISLRERRKRLAAGAIQFLIALIVFVVLIATDAGRLWRLILFPMFWGAAVGFFQWRDRT